MVTVERRAGCGQEPQRRLPESVESRTAVCLCTSHCGPFDSEGESAAFLFCSDGASSECCRCSTSARAVRSS